MKTYKHKTLNYTAKQVDGITDRYKIEGETEFILKELVEDSCDWIEVEELENEVESLKEEVDGLV